MSTLKTGKVKTTTIADELDTESTAVTNVINGSAKAWVNFDGTGTPTIHRGFNVSSLTDNGVGNYTVNFTTAMTDANYSPQVNNPFASNSRCAASCFSYTTGSVKVYFTLNGAGTDTGVGSVAVFS